MNEHGLAVSLAFGGRPIVGRGFGSPKIIRYVLEYAKDVPSAVDILRSVPSHMSYNVTLVDRSGAAATVFLSPDRPVIAAATRYAANHQIGVEWPRHARTSNTLEREQTLAALDGAGVSSTPHAVSAFLSEPLYTTGYNRGFGTVYTALYRPRDLSITLHWLDGARRTAWIGGAEMPPIFVAYGVLGAHEVSGAATPPHAAESAAERLLVSVRRRNTLAREADWDNLNGLSASESSERQGP
jgi:predicted choloylglycine hydrolase